MSKDQGMRRTGLPRRAVVLVVSGLVVASATAAATAALLRSPAPLGPAASPAHDVLATLPISFEATDGGFVSRGAGYSFGLTPAGAVVGVHGGSFGLRPAGPLVNAAAQLEPAQPLSGTITRITGSDPSQWRSGAATYARVSAKQVWPGVDMVWHGDQRRLQHDMVVAPGTDPAVVAFDVEGARSLTVDPAGDLVIHLGATTARLARPVLYQEAAGARRPVDGAFAILGPSRIGYSVGAYDAALPLVIDPTLLTSTHLGGAGIDAGYAIAVDAQGNTYVAGTTESADFLTQAPLQTALSGDPAVPSADAFVSKFSPDGSRLIWSTFLGGTGRDTGFGVAVAGDGSVYVSGVTESANFPVARGAQLSYGGGASDGFVARIAANGTGIEWSSFIGGGGADRARGLAVDSTGNAYLTGSTNSDNFPSVNAQQPGPFRPEDLDAFVAKFPPAGAPFTYATRLGGGNDDRGLAIAVDAQGNAYVTGDTLSPGFPTVRPIQASSGGSAGGVAGAFSDAFVAKYNPTGNALVYSTFLGGSDFDQGTAIAVDAQGAVYVAGNTNSPNFPTTGALQGSKGNDPDAFVTKIDAPGSAVVYSTYIGGSGADGANGIAVDRTGSAHVVGTTGSANFVVAKATQGAKSGGDDAFVLKLDSTGRGPLFSSFLGGRETDAGMGVALNAQGAVRVLGLTASADFPSVKPVAGVKPPAQGDAFVASIEVIDPVVPTTAVTETQAAPATSATADDAHDRRVRFFGIAFVVILALAVAQTMYLRRRTPAPATASRRPGGPPARPAAKPAASAGVTLPEKGPAAGAGAKSTRSPKARGGPKSTTPQKKAAQARKAAERRARKEQAAAAAAAASTTEDKTTVDVPADDLGDGGPPTVIAPPPEPPKARPQTPAIASLLKEDLWAPEPSEGDDGAPAEGEAPAPAPAPTAEVEAEPVEQAPAAPEWAPFDTGSTPVVGDAPPPAAPPAPGVPIPPVPAEELSFWDLFPEDLPPARTPAPFPADDALVDPLALPEGPASASERLAAEPAPDTPGPPPQAEIVIAELLDGPPPSGMRMSAQSQWAPTPESDFFIDDLLVDRSATPPVAAAAEDANGDDDSAGDDMATASQGRRPEDAARIAADQARRRRSRRGGRGRPPGSQ
jgi:hypothetical protein